MKLIINIPKEFEEHFNKDKFSDSLARVASDIENFGVPISGRYEQETITMLRKAFEDATPLEAQPTDKCKGCYYNDGETHAECVVCDKKAQPNRCDSCTHYEEQDGSSGMTNELKKAIETVKAYLDMDSDVGSEYLNAQRMIIQALEQQPCEDKGEISDGYHTFNQLYHQRAILFATIVNQNKDKAWKSFKHSDGHYCFDEGGEMFIVGIDTPKGSYTYHYHKKYWDYFDCKELEYGKVWDGHTEEDVTRLLSLDQQPCDDCISRQAVLDYAKDTCLDLDKYEDTEVFCDEIKSMPSVTPQRPKGKWMECGGDEPWLKGYCCSLCNFTTTQKYDYCTCGAKMEGGEDEISD